MGAEACGYRFGCNLFLCRGVKYFFNSCPFLKLKELVFIPRDWLWSSWLVENVLRPTLKP